MSRFTKYFARNNVKGTLFLSISQADTSIQLESGEGERFWNEFPFYATLENVDTTFKVLKREIVRCIWRNWDILNVERAVAPCPASDDDNTQGQTAFDFDAWDTISIYITADIVNAIQNSLNDLYNNWNDRLYVKGTWGLNISVSWWNVRFNNAEHYYNWWTATLTDNATNYVMLDNTDTIIIDTTAFDNAKISLAEVITASGEIVSITPKKIDSWTWDLWGSWSLLYWDWSDWDMIISENTILNAGYQYQFTNLTICPWVVVSFSWEGWGRIKVNNTFINCWTIDMTDLDVKKGCYIEEDFKQVLCNCTWGYDFIPWRWWCWWDDKAMLSTSWKYYISSWYVWWNWWDAIWHPTCCCVWAWWSVYTYWFEHIWLSWWIWYNMWWWWWWSSFWNWSPWNWLNWWNWWNTTCCYWQWWWGWWWYYTWNWWNWWNWKIWWNWWNWWILWNWWNWWCWNTCYTWRWWDWWDWVCWWNWWYWCDRWWNWWNWFYWWRWWDSYWQSYSSWRAWNWWDWVIPWTWWTNLCNCANCIRYSDLGNWKWWNWISALHSLELKVCNFCNCWCICSEWSVWWRWWCWCVNTVSFPWWRWWNGWMIMLVVDCMLEYWFISVEWWEGWLYWWPCCLDRHWPRWLPWCLIYFCWCK